MLCKIKCYARLNVMQDKISLKLRTAEFRLRLTKFSKDSKYFLSMTQIDVRKEWVYYAIFTRPS